MCWFHMRKAANEKLSILGTSTDDMQLRNSIQEDIDSLHNSPSTKLFETGVQHFINKWKASSNPHISQYLTYFEKEWIASHKGWFIGYMAVHTNNGLESTNAVIKKEGTLRKRLSMAMFLKAATDLTSDWSRERHPEHFNYRKPFATNVTLSTQLYRKAYEWLKNPTRVTIQNQNIYYSRSKSVTEQTLTSADVKSYKTAITNCTFTSFDDYVYTLRGIWCTTLNNENYLKSTCTCPSFFNHYICKHIIGVAAMAKIIKIPSTAKTMDIGQKPARGRPSKTKKALERQPMPPPQPPQTAATSSQPAPTRIRSSKKQAKNSAASEATNERQHIDEPAPLASNSTQVPATRNRLSKRKVNDDDSAEASASQSKKPLLIMTTRSKASKK